MELLLGCGHEQEKRMGFGVSGEWSDLTTLDINPDVNPMVLWDLNKVPLPFPDNSADEIHAYDVLEHVGQQGDYKFFFSQFEDFWRILKPNGYLFATVPWITSTWLWGDPGHTRTINNGTISFLDQRVYEDKSKTKRTDYRSIYHADFRVVHSKIDSSEVYEFALKAIKPTGAQECHPQLESNQSLSE